MKKVVSILLAMVMIVTVATGCKKKEVMADPYEVYKNAADKMADLNEVDMEMLFEIDVISAKVSCGLSLQCTNLSVFENIKTPEDISKLKEVEMNLGITMATSSIGGSSVKNEANIYIADGFVYLSDGNSKQKISIDDMIAQAAEAGSIPGYEIPADFDMSELKELVDAIDIDEDSFVLEENTNENGDTKISITVPGSNIKKSINSLIDVFYEYIGDQLSGLLFMSEMPMEYYDSTGYETPAIDKNAITDQIKQYMEKIDFSDLRIKMTVNKNGEFSRFNMKFSIVFDGGSPNSSQTIATGLDIKLKKSAVVKAPADLSEYSTLERPEYGSEFF